MKSVFKTGVVGASIVSAAFIATTLTLRPHSTAADNSNPAPIPTVQSASFASAMPPKGKREVREMKTKEIQYTVTVPVREQQKKTINYVVSVPKHETKSRIDPATGKSVGYTAVTIVKEARTKDVEYTVTKLVNEQRTKTINYVVVRYEDIDLPQDSQPM